MELKAIFSKLQVKTSLEKILIIISSLIFLLVMHVFVPNIGGVVAKQVDYVIWFLCGAITLVSAIKVLKSGRFVEVQLNTYLFLFASLWLVSILFNPIKNIENFLYYTFRLLGSIVFLIALLQFQITKRQMHTILFVLYISCVMEASIGIIQFYGLYRYIPVTPSPEEGLVGGVFQQKNVFASWIATGLVVSLYLVSTFRFEKLGKIKRVIFFVSLFAVSTSLVLANSRTGFVGIAFGALILVLARRRQFSRFKINLLAWFLVFFSGIVLGFRLVALHGELGLEELAKARVKWFADYTTDSPKGRILMYDTVWEMFKKQPFFGHGFSNFGSLYMYYESQVKKGRHFYKGLDKGYTHHPHSELALIVAESGLLGLIGILILCYGVFKVFRRLGFERAGAYLAFLLPILIHSLLEFPLHISSAHWFCFILLFALSIRHFNKVSRLNLSGWKINILVSLASAVFVGYSAFLIKTFVDYNRLTIWYIEYNEHKKADLINLEGAAKNIYLKNFAKPMYMFAKAEGALDDIEKNKEFLFEFLKWSEAEKQRLPTVQIFLYDSLVLLKLGMHYRQHVYFDEAMKSVEQGLSLYPENRDLKEMRKRILHEALKTIYSSATPNPIQPLLFQTSSLYQMGGS